MDVTRHAMLNMGFFGNPPNYWNENDHKKEEMLAAFGKYTLPIISRLTLIFAKPTLSNGKDASSKIKGRFYRTWTKQRCLRGKDQINNLRSFFREYLKYVSRLQPKLGVYSALIESLFQQIEETEGFKEAFANEAKPITESGLNF